MEKIRQANNEEEIIKSILAGEVAFFEKIIRKYNTLLYRIGWGYLKHEMDVEDSMQNCYLKAFEKLNQFSFQSSFSTWLTRIMINECLMLLRKGKEVYPVELPETPIYPTQIANIDDKHMSDYMEAAIKELPENYRAVYIFREIQGFSVKETAELLSLSEQNVKVRLHRAKELLKDLLISRIGKKELLEYHRPKCDQFTSKVMRLIDA